ncbi:HNH endonuclease signature motif containing protein [Curtobacterium sp. MCBD17_008]|uniref:HNH endonuclease signature motif containing protein n=1 Tax=Curtobacterium sp. MCBD17_008 TaxID=2175656 RepID=UPI000DA861DA|nr:HNH endonuclease [Curtobacterium sp. MCBD17_008]
MDVHRQCSQVPRYVDQAAPLRDDQGCLMPRPAASLEDRIPGHVQYTPFGCWHWTGYLDRDGYGVMKYQGVPQAAHRLAYTQWVGPVPEGHQLDHLCRNRACVNPEHLEPVTTQVNTARGIKPNRGTCRNGHPRTASNVYTTPQGHRACRPCRQDADARYKARQAA